MAKNKQKEKQNQSQGQLRVLAVLGEDEGSVLSIPLGSAQLPATLVP